MAKLKYRPIHNPEKVPESEIPSGHRFLNRDEIIYNVSTEGKVIKRWIAGVWHSGWHGTDKESTYCTNLSPEDLKRRRTWLT
jgi:hypothetical protein